MPGGNSRCNSSALHENSRMSSPLGAGNYFCRGREFLSRAQGIRPSGQGMPMLRCFMASIREIVGRFDCGCGDHEQQARFSWIGGHGTDP
jgi:hypothetical protein